MKKLFVVLFLLFGGMARAQVTLDANAVSFVSSATAVTSLSVTTLTVGVGTNRALVAQFTGTTASGCVWDAAGANQALAQIVTKTQSVTAQLWGLVNPVSGNKILTCSFSSHAYVSLNGTSFNGVDQTGSTTTFYNSGFATGSGSAVSLTISTTANDAAIDSVSSEDGVVSPTQSVLFTDVPITGAGASYAVNAGSSVVFGWTNGTHPWVDVGTAIKSAAVVGGTYNLNLLGVGK